MRRETALALLIAFTALVGDATAGEKKKAPLQLPELKPLWTGKAPGALGDTPADIPGIYLFRAANPNGTAIVVCPGGGYGGLAMDHEGKQIGEWLNKLGITAAVLKYRLGSAKYRHPVELGDAQRALRTVRANADAWKIDPAKIGILGFSAGGHLTSTAGTHFDSGKADAADPIDRVSCRPDFMVLLYPVITLEPPFAHMGSRNNLLGKDAPAELVKSLSNEQMVTKETPPTFLVHTSEDRGVPPENSVLFYLALQKNKVPAELHIYEKGGHGLGMGPANLPFSSWPGRCEAWLRGRGLLPAEKK
jgi:acetyl esterase/lipase